MAQGTRCGFEDQIYQIYGSYYRRCHKPVLAVGKAYVQKLSEACLKNGVRILTSTRFEAFEKDADGGFTVQALSGTDLIEIRCRALVLAAAVRSKPSPFKALCSGSEFLLFRLERNGRGSGNLHEVRC